MSIKDGEDRINLVLVVALNPKHRPYPRKYIEPKEWPAMIREVEADLPEEYRNASLLMELKKQETSHQERSSSLCLPPPPPHIPIKPFSYLETNGN